MRIVIIILLFFSALTTFSQTKQESAWRERFSNLEEQVHNIEQHQHESEVAILKDKLDFQQKISEQSKSSIRQHESEMAILKDKFDFQQKMSEQSISSISNQLDSASYSLTIFGILFTIASIVLGFYVTFIERKNVRIGEENKELLSKNQKIKDDIEAINQLIQSDIYNLFIKIKREETVHILDRLLIVPKDITNVCNALLSRELEQEDFTKLRQAYLNLGENGGEYKHQYRVLFFQHFLSRSLCDENLKVDISDFIPIGILSSFENDILKSTADFTTLVVDKSVHELQTEIRLFFNGLANSQYKNFSPVYQMFFDNLKSRKNRFELFSSVESVPEQRIAKIEYGKILQENYSNDNPTQSELLALEDLKELIINQQKDDEDAKQMAEEQRIKQEELQRQR